MCCSYQASFQVHDVWHRLRLMLCARGQMQLQAALKVAPFG